MNAVKTLHCLYCNQPLSPLKRRNGGAEFCSAEHDRLYYKQESDRLSQEQPSGVMGELLPSTPESLKVIVCAHRVFGSSEKAERWMKSYSEPLEAKPIDLFATTEGRERVLEELARIEHGIF